MSLSHSTEFRQTRGEAVEAVIPADPLYIEAAREEATAEEAVSSRIKASRIIAKKLKNCLRKEVALPASLCYYLCHEDNCKSQTNK